MKQNTIVVSVADPMKWFFSQLGQLVIAVGLISLIFNYGYRYAVDWNVSGAWFYAATFGLAFLVFLIFRWDYVFVNRLAFSADRITVHTLFGLKKTYDTQEWVWVPSLHKVVNLPEKAAQLSFHVQNRKTGKNSRNYGWTGFSREDFQRVSALYGYDGATDFKQADFGRS